MVQADQYVKFLKTTNLPSEPATLEAIVNKDPEPIDQVILILSMLSA